MSILLRKYTHTYSHKHTLLRHIGLTLYAKRATIIHKVIEVFFLVIFEGQSSGNVTGYKKIMREESHKNNKKLQSNGVSKNQMYGKSTKCYR